MTPVAVHKLYLQAETTSEELIDALYRKADRDAGHSYPFHD
jgi:hypothetical protein